ncbi:MAG: hypothetical protein QG608_455 [Actinomycetota bacterium]|nr:hypothetical protein [Actinomycetota bacterium]
MLRPLCASPETGPLPERCNWTVGVKSQDIADGRLDSGGREDHGASVSASRCRSMPCAPPGRSVAASGSAPRTSVKVRLTGDPFNRQRCCQRLAPVGVLRSRMLASVTMITFGPIRWPRTGPDDQEGASSQVRCPTTGCRVRESNPHAFRRRILSALCLPFHQPGAQPAVDRQGRRATVSFSPRRVLPGPSPGWWGALRDRPVTWVILAGPGIADLLSPPTLGA